MAEEPEKTETPEEDPRTEIEKCVDLVARLYYKVGGFFKLSYQEFEAVPYPILIKVIEMMDEKTEDMDQFFSSEEVAMFKNLRRMFPKKD